MTSEIIYPEFDPTYLMIKQHAVTKKLYLCKSIRKDALTSYKGSGVYWLNHIKSHGTQHVETIWHRLFVCPMELYEYAIILSTHYDIVNSDEWANLEIENGFNGGVKGKGPYTGVSPEKREAMARKSITTRKNKPEEYIADLNARIRETNIETWANMSECEKIEFSRLKSEATKRYLSEASTEKIESDKHLRLIGVQKYRSSMSETELEIESRRRSGLATRQWETMSENTVIERNEKISKSTSERMKNLSEIERKELNRKISETKSSGKVVTPWGEFTSASLAANDVNSPISSPTIYTITKNLNSPASGKLCAKFNVPKGTTHRELGFDFIPNSTDQCQMRHL